MKPLNRKETYLARMAGEDVTMPTPNTREEAWMKGLAEAINGKNDVKTPEPLTRGEQYLKTVTEKLVDATSDLIEKTVTENGVYTAKSDDADGYSKVTVNVESNLITKTVTENGTYTATDDSADGYSTVTVNVPINTNNANFADGTGAFNLEKLERISIPNGYTSLQDLIFYGVSSLEFVELPSTLTNIGQSTFTDCTNLRSIDIPSGVKTIWNTFTGCTSLTSITVRATNPPALVNGASSLEGVPADANIYVPSASVDAYKAANGWSTRADYIQAIPE